MVGREMLRCLEQFRLPIGELRLFASSKSAGQKIFFFGNQYTVEELHSGCFSTVDIALFSAGGSVSKEFAPRAAAEGAVVIDNSSAFRMQRDVPLIVPEVNPEKIPSHNGIIANPNCSTIQLVVVLKPILEAFGLQKVIVSTYQSVSGAGKQAVDELIDNTGMVLKNKKPQPSQFPVSIAFNVIPQIGDIGEEGSCFEEEKMINETRKILEQNELHVAVTTVRVPVFIGHSETVYFQTIKKTDPQKICELLNRCDGIKVIGTDFPTAFDSEKDDRVLVGRLRYCNNRSNEFLCWIVANNLRKGAALNAVQIAHHLIKKGLI